MGKVTWTLNLTIEEPKLNHKIEKHVTSIDTYLVSETPNDVDIGRNQQRSFFLHGNNECGGAEALLFLLINPVFVQELPEDYQKDAWEKVVCAFTGADSEA